MSRSLKKGLNVDERILKKVQALPVGSKTVIKVWKRASVISPEMVGYTFGVHDGRRFVTIVVIEDMVGHRFGEFAQTRKFVRHSGDK